MNKLNVCVDFELTLDAGWWEEVRGGDGSVQRLVHPPATTLFDQLIAYLSKVPDKEPHYFLRLQEEVAAAFAVCVRWGTYFAVLADRTKPPCAEMGIEDASRIDDGEMARINIEASAALAQWIDMKRGDFNRYRALVYAARHHLPLTRYTCDPTTRQGESEEWLTNNLLVSSMPPSVLAQFGINQSDQTQDERWQKAHRNAEAYPTRILANTLVNACWRNGPIEDIHAGKEYAYSLNRCRITRDEERLLTRTTLNRMKQALKVVDDLHYEQSKRSWSERVMPFATAFFIAPHNWSLQEHSREIWLPGSEPITQ